MSKINELLIKKASESVLGVSGLNVLSVGTVLEFEKILEAIDNRPTVNEDNPMIVFKADDTGHASVTANAFSSIRVLKIGDAAAALEGLKDTVVSTGMMQTPHVSFMKEYVENADGGFDIEKIKLVCKKRVNIETDGKKVMIPTCYNDSAQYYKEVRAAETNDEYNAAREKLHASGLKDGMESKNPTDEKDASLFVWTPIFEVAV